MSETEPPEGGTVVLQAPPAAKVRQAVEWEVSAPAESAELVWRLRVLVGVLLLAALSFRQSGGRVVPDTKLDLTANPSAFLRRAFHMWDPLGAMGQLQNQAYGYLFPVGPFHWVLSALAASEWVVQRLWWSVVLGVAFVGMWRLLCVLGIGSPWARYVAGLLFALGPRFMSEVAVTSVEVWPMALAPWVLLPLVSPRSRSWAWRITGSACAFLLVGGVNAVATAAVLIPPTVWFTTRKPLSVAARWFLVWIGAMIAVSLWWLVPLGLLGRFSPPFLNWIEDASVTTSFASPFEALRGTTPWLNYLTGAAGPSWPAGWELVTSPLLVALTAGLAVAGLVGIRLVPRQHRGFLGLCLLTGLMFVTLGHSGPGGSPMAGSVQSLLDGPLAPLRNTHKFELVVRLPLTIGLAQALTLGARRVRTLGLAPWLAPVAAVSAIVMVASPGITAGLARPEGYAAIPQHWRDAAAWLDDHAGSGTTMVTPAAGFADFSWGSTKDDPLQALTSRPFVVRDAVPLGSAGTTRWLDEVEDRLQGGIGGAALRSALTSAGVRYVLVRNDLRPDTVDSAGAQNLRVHEALAETGITAAASFGPRVTSPAGTEPETPDHTIDQKTRLPYPSIEIFDVGPTADAALVPGDRVVTVHGGAEDVADALAAVDGSGAAVVGSDIEALPAGVRDRATSVVMDGNQAREVFFGRASNNTSQVLGPGDPRRTGRPVTGFVADPAAPQTTRVWGGLLRGVSASSSAADANASIRIGSGYGPAAAVDGDTATAWLSGRYASAAGEWLQLDFASPTDVSLLSVTLEQSPRRLATPTEIRVETDGGSETTQLAPLDTRQDVRTAPGLTTRARITITEVAEGADANGVGLAEVSVPGIVGSTRLDVPPTDFEPSVVVLRRTSDGRSACAWVDTRPMCTSGAERQPEAEGGIRRTLHLSTRLMGAVRGTVVARPGDAVEQLLKDLTNADVTASSRAVPDLAGRPDSAMDGDLGTGWVASPADRQPRITIAFPSRISADRVQLQRDAFLAASAAAEVAVSFDGGPPEVMHVDSEGYLRWERRRFSTLGLQFMDRTPVRSTDSASGIGQVLPVGISEVVVPGFNPVGPLRPSSTTGAQCGFGPNVVVDGTPHSTAVRGTVAQLLRGEPLSWTSCNGDIMSLGRGTTTIDAPQSAEFSPVSLVISGPASPRAGSTPTPMSTPVLVSRPDAARLTLEVPEAEGQSVLVVHQNFSAGWVATDGAGGVLTPIRVNGWQQGWVIPAGPGQVVHAAFAPDVTFRIGLVGGWLLAVLVLVAGFMLRRRCPVPPLQARPGWGLRWDVLLVAGLTVGAGLVGLVAAGVGVLAGRALSRRATIWLVMCTGMSSAPLVVIAGAWPEARTGVDSTLVQTLVLTALAACFAGLGDDTRGSRRELLRSFRCPQRMIGRSRK